MADISDVENAIVAVLVESVYPLGSNNPSIFGNTCRIYRGWPNTATLNNDLSNSIVNITVATDNDSGRLTTRYMPKFQTSVQQPGVSIAVSGSTALLGGSPQIGDLVGLIVDGVGYSYRIQACDTAAMVAANLAQIVRQARPVALSGLSISIPGAYSVRGRAFADGMTVCEARRQEKDCRVIVWCFSPEIRDTVCLSIDMAMVGISFLPLPDGSSARLTYKNTTSFDQAEDALLYRRDLIFSVEYPTLTSTPQAPMMFGNSALDGQTTTG